MLFIWFIKFSFLLLNVVLSAYMATCEEKQKAMYRNIERRSQYY